MAKHKGRVSADIRAEWERMNMIPEKHELCIEEDTNRWKLGDGVRRWSELGYMPGEDFSEVVVKSFEEWIADTTPIPKGCVAAAEGTRHVVTGNGNSVFWELLDLPFVLYDGKPVDRILLEIMAGGDEDRPYPPVFTGMRICHFGVAKPVVLGFAEEDNVIELNGLFRTNSFIAYSRDSLYHTSRKFELSVFYSGQDNEVVDIMTIEERLVFDPYGSHLAFKASDIIINGAEINLREGNQFCFIDLKTFPADIGYGVVDICFLRS